MYRNLLRNQSTCKQNKIYLQSVLTYKQLGFFPWSQIAYLCPQQEVWDKQLLF